MDKLKQVIVIIGTTAYGASNLFEAGQNIYYGGIGDDYTAAINPIRDTVFMGNQKAYDIWGGISTTAAGLIVPVGQAYAGAKMSGLTGRAVYGAVGKTFVKELSYDIAGDVIGSGTSSFVFDLTGNVNLSRFAGLSAGMMTSGNSGKSLNHVDNVTSGTVKGLNHADRFTSTSKKFDRFADVNKADDKIKSVGNKLKPINTEDLEVIEVKTPEKANCEWLTRGYDKPPYNSEFEVKVVKAGNEKYVRVFSYDTNGNSNKLGGWLMKKSDIEGLTPKQIANKYALPKEPTHICDVNINLNYNLQTGVANPVPGWGSGGGQQFDTMGKKLPQSAFVNERLIGE